MTIQLPSKRLFLGIPLPQELIKFFYQFHLEHSYLKNIRWIPKENLHITLCFIGNTTMENSLVLQLDKIADRQKSFLLRFEKFCLAPERKPYMIWARFKENEHFNQLAISCYRLLTESKKLQPPREPFIPHVTLARFDRQNNLLPLHFNFPFKNQELEVQQLILWESVLSTSGSTYIRLKEYDLE